jgi:Zn-dependent alcohol dehydrogenase
MKVRAAVLRQIGLPPPYKDSRPLAIDAVDLAPPGRDEVLVRIRAAGLPPPEASFGLPLVNLVAEERTLKGSYIGTCVPARGLPRYAGLYRGGRLPVDRLMSGRLRLDDINEGFDRLHAGEAVRQVVVFD